jgi:hypothetical protein
LVNVPGPQVEQVLAVGDPPKLPTWQSRHAVALDDPLSGLYLPRPHAVHTVELDAS